MLSFFAIVPVEEEQIYVGLVEKLLDHQELRDDSLFVGSGCEALIK
jgi:hypothetical protein